MNQAQIQIVRTTISILAVESFRAGVAAAGDEDILRRKEAQAIAVSLGIKTLMYVLSALGPVEEPTDMEETQQAQNN